MAMCVMLASLCCFVIIKRHKIVPQECSLIKVVPYFWLTCSAALSLFVDGYILCDCYCTSCCIHDDGCLATSLPLPSNLLTPA